MKLKSLKSIALMLVISFIFGSGLTVPVSAKTKLEIIWIKADYNEIEAFSGGLAKVRKDKGDKEYYGYINKKGKEIISLKYSDANSFNEGLAAVQKGKKWGYIDNTGKVIIDFKYAEAKDFSEGYAAVKKGKKWGYVDKSGETVIPFEYDDAQNFSGGFAGVGKKKGSYIEGYVKKHYTNNYGFINKSGEEVIELKYDLVKPFSEGMAVVGNDGHFAISRWSIGGYSIGDENCYYNGKLGFVDTTGQELNLNKYNEAKDFHEGLAAVKKGKKWGYINNSGEEVISFK